MTMDDPDSPWEDNPGTDHIPEAEWTKIASDFTNAGYREGIAAGKDAFLQAGFDDGFANVGVPLGRELGNLRGVTAAIGALLNSQTSDSSELEELGSISSILSAIQFSDIAPRDLEAERHAKEHLGVDELAILGNEDPGSQQRRYTMDDFARVKERLALLCTKLGLPVLCGDTR